MVRFDQGRNPGNGNDKKPGPYQTGSNSELTSETCGRVSPEGTVGLDFINRGEGHREIM